MKHPHLALMLWLWLVGMLADAHALMSIAMIGLFLNIFFVTSISPFKITFRKDLGSVFQSFLQRPDWWASCLLFFLVLFSSIYSTEDSSYLMTRLRIALPFLVIPFGIFALPDVGKKGTIVVFYSFLFVLCIAIFYSIFYYIYDYEVVIQEINRGGYLPLTTNHVRFSLMVAFGIFVAAYFYIKKITLYYSWEKWLHLGLCFGLIIYLHVLAVRSGLACFYGTFLLNIFIFLIYKRKILLGSFFTLLLILLCFLLYKTSPSLQTKVAYSLYDWEQYKTTRDLNYSDTRRWVSMEIGLKIGNENPILGIGAGDLRNEVRRKYRLEWKDLPYQQCLMPHNQWIWAYAATGIFGVLVTTFAFFTPLFYKQNYQHTLLFSFVSIFLLSCLVEATIENALGVSFYTGFLFILLKYKHWI